MTRVSEETRRQIVSLVREFVTNDVLPIASRYDNEDTYPHDLVPTMRELGLFGITIPEEYGGLGLDHTTMAMIFEAGATIRQGDGDEAALGNATRCEFTRQAIGSLRELAAAQRDLVIGQRRFVRVERFPSP